MKKFFASVIVVLITSTFLFASEVEGKWITTIETENGPFTFSVIYKVEGEKLSGTFYSESGTLDFYDGNISGEEFEYTFYIDSSFFKHQGKLVDGKLVIKSSGDYGDFEYTMTRVKEE